jgi:hypothetical protein
MRLIGTEAVSRDGGRRRCGPVPLVAWSAGRADERRPPPRPGVTPALASRLF